MKQDLDCVSRFARISMLTFAIAGAMLLGACQSDLDNGTTRTESKRVVETPDEKVTTTTKTERKVQDHPN
jgi:hypothetical protein